jgi:uncharacterized protein
MGLTMRTWPTLPDGTIIGYLGSAARPLYKIEVDGRDVTAGFNDRATDIKVTLHNGMQADDFHATFDDRDWQLQPPRKGAILKCWMDDGRHGLALMGAFEIKGRRRRFDKDKGRELEVTGKSAHVRQSVKSPRSGEYKDGTTYQQLADEVAGRHGLVAKVSPSIASMVLGWEPQTEESDLHLMTRLAREIDAISQWSNGRLILLSRDDQAAAPQELRESDFISCDVNDDDRARHGKSGAHYDDKGKNRRGRVAHDNDEDGAGDAPETGHRDTFSSKSRAKGAAKGLTRKMQRGESGLAGVMTGDNTVVAGLPRVIEWGVEMFDGNWDIKQAEHHINKDAGYKTSIKCDKGLSEGQRKGSKPAYEVHGD